MVEKYSKKGINTKNNNPDRVVKYVFALVIMLLILVAIYSAIVNYLIPDY